jgi:hypothetical protein
MSEPSQIGRPAIGWSFRLVVMIFIFGLLALLVLCTGYVLHEINLFRRNNQTQILDTPAVLRQIQGLQELSTVKYHLERIVAVTDPGWLGDERLVLIAHGVVKAGIDFSQVDAEDIRFDAAAGTVQMTLPPAKVLDVYLDERLTQVYLHEKSIFRRLNKDLNQIARRDALAQIQSAAKDLGVKEDAQQRAEMQLRKMFESLGVRSVEIQFRN